MSLRFPKASGLRDPRVLAALLLLVFSGCIYHFTGGGLPGNIRTVAVLPFDNTTPQPLLEADIQRALQEALPRNLGVRIANEEVADAIIRGQVTGYAEVPASFRPTQPGQSEVPVVQRQVRITYNAEIYDVEGDKLLWRGQSQSVIGNYQPDSETEKDGRDRAIEELVNNLIQGAQSQW